MKNFHQENAEALPGPPVEQKCGQAEEGKQVWEAEVRLLFMWSWADHGEADGQVQRQRPALGHAGDSEGDDDFCRDIELQGVAAQDAEDVEELDGLVQPAGQTRAMLSEATTL